MGMPVRKEDIVRIEMIDPPETQEKGEGLYEWRHMTDRYTMDMFTLGRQLEEYMPGRSVDILDRLQNFWTVYMNLSTGEVST